MRMASAVQNEEFSLDDSQQYVEAVMSSHDGASTATDLSAVKSPSILPQSRKRFLSVPDSAEFSVKKVKGDSAGGSGREVLKPRRMLYAQKDNSGHINNGNDNEDDTDLSTKEMITVMSSSMKTMFENLNRKVDTLASEIEERLTKKFSQLLDKRHSKEISKVKSDINSRIDIVKEDIYRDIENLDTQVKDLSTERSTLVQEDDIALRIVLRNVPETRNENVIDTVNGIMRDGLRLRDVSVKKAERKQSDSQNNGRSKAPVIVATLKSREDKQAVMDNKKKLKDDRNKHKMVFIHSDQTKAERLQRANFRTILDSIQKGESDQLEIRGSRVVRSTNRSDNYGHRNQGSEQQRQRRNSSTERTRQNGEETGERRRERDADRNVRDRDYDRMRNNADYTTYGSRQNRPRPNERSRR